MLKRRKNPSSNSLSFQRSLLRWNDLRRLRKGLVRARHHSLRSGANHINEENRHGEHGFGLGLTRRATRAALPLLLLALMLMIGRRYAVQQLDVEAIVRGQVIPQLEAQYHTTVKVGAVESDWLNRIVLYDVVIGRDLSSPLGALAKARSVTVNLDITGLALRRLTPLEAVHDVALDEPQVWVLRDANGRFNFQDLFRDQQPTGPKWIGRVRVQNGRLWYEDHAFKSASGKMALADARGLNGWAILNGNGPTEFDLKAQQTYLGPQKVLLAGVTTRGALGAAADWAMADLFLPPVPAPFLADYAFRKGELTAQVGTVGGKVSLAWDKALPGNDQITARGELLANNVALQSQQLKLPGANNPLPLSNISGPVSFDGRTLETRGMVLTALNSSWRAAGRLSLHPQPIFDVVVHSDGADTTRLVQIAKTQLRSNRLLQEANLSANRARLDLHLTGDLKGVRFAGRVDLPSFNASHRQYGTASSPFLRTVLDGSGNSQGAQMTARLTLPQLKARRSGFGSWQSNGFDGDFKLAFLQNQPARIEGAFNSKDVVVSGQDIRARMARLATNIKVVATREPQLELHNLQAQNVRGTARRDALQMATLLADLKLSGQKWDSRFRANALSSFVARHGVTASNIRGQASGSSLKIANAQIRGDLQAANLVARLPEQGTLRSEGANASAFWTGNGTSSRNLPGGRLWGRADLKNASVAQTRFANAGAVSGRAVIAKVRGYWANLRGAQPASADITLVAFAASSQRYGNLSGQNLRLLANTPNAPNQWQGQAVTGALNVSKLKLAVLSPQAAREVRNLGTVSGQIQFANIGPEQKPSINGNLRLSRVTLRDVALSDVSANVSFDGNRLRLANAVAQSNLGALSGNLETTLNAQGTPNLQGLRFAFGTQNLTINANQINPYLKAQNIQAEGTARGTLRLGSTGAANTYQARFDLQMPVTVLRPVNDPRPAATARLTEARVRGSGAIRFVNANRWQFTGDAVLAAQQANFEGEPAGQETDRPVDQLDGFSAPIWLHGSRGDALRLTLRGSLTRDENGLQPRLAGDVELANIHLPLPPQNSRPLSLREARAEFIALPDSLQLPRLTAYSFDGEFNGHATMATDGTDAVRGQILAERLDVSQVRAWLAPLLKESARDWAMRGRGFLQADFSGTRQELDTKVQARFYDGAVRWKQIDVPLDVARANFSIQLPDWKTIPIESLAVWSRGARFAINGVVARSLRPTNGIEDLLNVGLDLKATLTDLRATRLNEIPSFVNTQREAGLDGLLSGDVRVQGTAREPKISGRAAVRLAEAFGINVAQAEGELTASFTPDGPVLSLQKINGRAEGTTFTGNLAANYPQNLWEANFITEGLAPNRVLRAADDLTNLQRQPNNANGDNDRVRFPLRTLPLRGSLGANIALSGQLETSKAKTALETASGLVQVRGEDLRWRGLPLGTVTADLSLENGLFTTRQLQLLREVVTPVQGGSPITEQASWKISGALPATPDAPGLDAKVNLEGERLAFFFQALEETRDALRLRAVTIPVLEQTVNAIEKLPPRLDGKVSLRADLKGRWNKPMVRVENLTVREASAVGPLGLQRALPVVDAAFDYDGQTFTIQSAALRLEGAKTPDGEAQDDTVLRVTEGGRFTPGGEIALQARVINANLSQLAPWVPALRGESGASLLSGELQQFAFEVGGTLENPRVNGAITAQNITYNKYSIDLLRISRFDIKDGFFQIERPNLTITKGAFQSSTAWGRIPWSWERPGPRLNAPIEVHLPLGREDLGAIAGTFVPALARADAEEFSGALNITGTGTAPRIGGELFIRDGRFLVDPAVLPFDAGLTGVTGKITFSEVNRVTISGVDGTGDLTGRLVPPDSIAGRATGNAPAELREISTTTPAIAATEQMKGQTAQNKAQTAKAARSSTKLSGAFALAGDVRLALDAVTGALDPDSFIRPLPMLDEHNYNLRLEVRDGAVATGDIAGVRNINLAAFWQTRQSGATRVTKTHRVRWMLGAEGTPERRRPGGAVYSLGALDLASDFGASAEAFGRSRVQLLDGLNDFEGLSVYRQITAPAALGPLKKAQPGRVVFRNFLLGVKNLVAGQIDGVLSLDNRPARARILPTTPRPSVAARVSAARAAVGSRGSNEFAGALLQDTQLSPPPVQETQGALLNPPDNAPDSLEDENILQPGGDGPIRVSGNITLSQATLSGTPAGGVSTGGELPPIPVMDLSLIIGRGVQFSVPNVRALIAGTVEVTGTPAEPLVAGTVSIPSGSIRFPTTQARILKGELRLTAYSDPTTDLMRTLVDINATARGQVGKYTITLDVNGPLDFGNETTQNLKIDVTSNPPLAMDQAFSLLLGTRGENLGQERYKDAILSVVSSPLLSGIEQSLQRILGLDTLALEYRFNEPITVQVGKAFGDRVYASYRRVLGERLTGLGETYTLRVEYRLKGDVQLGLELSDKYRSEDGNNIEAARKNGVRLSIEKTWRF